MAAGNGGKRGGRHGRRPWPAELAAKAREANKNERKGYREIEGRTTKLTKGKKETEAARRRLSARRGGRQSSETSGQRLQASSVHGKHESESGGQQGGAETARCRFKAVGARGRTLPRRGVERLRLAARPGGSEERGGEDGADKRARAVNGWARGVGGCLVRAQARLLGWARLLGRERWLG